jgi:hypothetical protein
VRDISSLDNESIDGQVPWRKMLPRALSSMTAKLALANEIMPV